MNWHQAVESISPHVFKLESPSGHGTGFLCFLNDQRAVMGIATARHVVSEANKWQQPIRVSNYQLEYSRLLTTTDRVILDDGSRDSAVILLDPSDLELPGDLVPLIPSGRILKLGVEVGWVGFPAVEPNTLCFFSGNISARISNDSAYLIDGVAINGVSGGLFSISKSPSRASPELSALLPLISPIAPPAKRCRGWPLPKESVTFMM
jgi:hypothetical protein